MMINHRETLRQEMKMQRAALSAEEKEMLTFNIQQRTAEFLESQPADDARALSSKNDTNKTVGSKI